MKDKPRRKPNDRPLKPDNKRVSLAPLDFEEALKGLLQAGPHPQDDKTAQDTEALPPRGRRKLNRDDGE